TTSDAEVAVRGSTGAVGEGEKVQASNDGGATWVDVSQDTGTSWHYDDPTTHGASFTYQARVIDAAANVGNTDSQAVTIDTAAPAARESVTEGAGDNGTGGHLTKREN